MANTNRPFGFTFIRNGVGASVNQQANLYYIRSGDTSQYNIGDAVISYAGADANGVPGIAKWGGTGAARGVIVGFCVSNPAGTSLQGTIIDNTVLTVPATKTTDYYAMVIDDPNATFIIQDDGITTANLVAANVNKNASATVTNPTSPSQVSATVLLSSSIATTQALALRIIGLYQDPAGSNAFGAYAKWVVKFNQHELMGNTAGI